MPAKIVSGHKSVKHDIIDKTNSRIVLAVGAATFVFVFCLFASKALISQSLYHGRVISEKEEALAQLEKNKQSVVELKNSFDAFQSEAQNILTGNPAGTGPLDGSNADIVLDALPNKYDYPALSSSFEKILRDGGYQIESIGGTEDTSLAATGQTPTGDSQPLEIPYSFSVSSDTAGIKRLFQTLEMSIRPMYLDSIQLQSSGSTLQTQVTLHTYFTQPKTFQVTNTEVK